MYFWIYGLPKTWLYKRLRSPVSEDNSASSMKNGSKHCSNLNDSTFTTFIDPCEENSGSIKPLSVVSKILGLFVNPFTSDNKYSLLMEGNLLQHFQMHLSQKRKSFSPFFFFFFFFLLLLNFNSILNIFGKTITLTADLFLNFPTPKYVVR